MEIIQLILGYISSREQIADWLSIIGAAASIYVALTVRRERYKVSRKAMLPQAIADVDTGRSSISSLLSDFARNEQELLAELQRTRSNLKILRSLIGRSPRSRLDEVVKYIEHCHSLDWRTSSLVVKREHIYTKIYGGLLGLMQEVNHDKIRQQLGVEQ
ncbi:hypothetical protein DXM21_19780 [Agrobacterium rosae]|nr:hypothetical protein DXM21_19780 [Agrobacterium rosae]KAA3514980.1 hypothetical protein DXM25_20590 [Agrobacterium rosae]MQB50694.1 hypothetical protein [Agrobacterium rosae]